VSLILQHWSDQKLVESHPDARPAAAAGEGPARTAVAPNALPRPVLMRQAGLRGPGVYGPAQEERAVIGMPPQE